MKQPSSLSKSQWSVWFPYPSSWLRSFTSILMLFGVTAIVQITIYWGLPISLILSNFQKDRTPVITFLVSVGFILPSVLISYIHHITFGKYPSHWHRWLPTAKSLWIGFYCWVVIILSTVFSFVLVIPFIDTYSFLQPPYYSFTEIEATWLRVIWLITAACLYQAEYLLRHRLRVNSKTASNRFTSSKREYKNADIDDIDVELNRLRGQMGLHNMKKKGKSKQKNN